MQDPVFLDLFRKFYRWLGDTGKIDGESRVIVLDGYASHMTIHVIQLGMATNNIKPVILDLSS